MDIADHRQYPIGSQPEVYSVPAPGCKVDQLFTIPAEALVSNKWKMILYQVKKGGENEWRKHHTSSITRDIWAYDMASHSNKMITKFESEDRQPVYGPND
jgi:tricorn protease